MERAATPWRRACRITITNKIKAMSAARKIVARNAPISLPQNEGRARMTAPKIPYIGSRQSKPSAFVLIIARFYDEPIFSRNGVLTKFAPVPTNLRVALRGRASFGSALIFSLSGIWLAIPLNILKDCKPAPVGTNNQPLKQLQRRFQPSPADLYNTKAVWPLVCTKRAVSHLAAKSFFNSPDLDLAKSSVLNSLSSWDHEEVCNRARFMLRSSNRVTSSCTSRLGRRPSPMSRSPHTWLPTPASGQDLPPPRVP